MIAAALALSLVARVGTGDPAEIFRDKDPQEDLVLHGQLRLRTAVFNNLDLDRGPSPTTGAPLFADGLVLGNDARVRLSPSLFIGDELRAFLDVDLATASLGQPPDGLPFGTPRLRGPLGGQAGDFGFDFLDVRAAGVDWLLPIGVLSIGRMPSHFALGIAANDGAALDDDYGDHADRVALILPVFGHLFAGAFDVLDPTSHTPGSASAIGDYAVTVAAMKWRAPWEIELYRKASRATFDYGGSLSYEWSSKNAPGLWSAVDASLHPDEVVVHRDTRFVVADLWARLVIDDLRVEGEGFLGDLDIENPSNIPGVIVRQPITGNPAALAAVVDWRVVGDATVDTTNLGTHLLVELGAASADPAPGFPTQTPLAFSGSQPGDAFGAQVDLKHGGDSRFDAARLHPLHRVDLILWRTLLGGVSEAGYARMNVAGSPLPWLRLEGNAIYSHAFSEDSAPGGAAPLGVEVDAAAEASLWNSGASLRVDAGNLFPLGGLAVRGGDATSLSSSAQMVLVRLGYAM